VDDNRDAADTLCLLASLWGHDARAAYDGASALRVAAACDPDVVLLNLSLPDARGAELGRRLRRDGRPALVAVTGHADSGHRREASAAGFDHDLLKPTDPQDVRSLLGVLLHTAHLPGQVHELAGEARRLTADLRRAAEELRVAAEETRRLLGVGREPPECKGRVGLRSAPTN
jgi:DNA-binding response OmpR family regulator